MQKFLGRPSEVTYGKGSAKTDLKRMADLGQTQMTRDLANFCRLCLLTARKMAQAVWPEAITDPGSRAKKLDRILLRVYSDASRRGRNRLWRDLNSRSGTFAELSL